MWSNSKPLRRCPIIARVLHALLVATSLGSAQNTTPESHGAQPKKARKPKVKAKKSRATGVKSRVEPDEMEEKDGGKEVRRDLELHVPGYDRAKSELAIRALT